MIELPEKDGVRLEYETEFDAERNSLIPYRVQNFTQQETADWLGVSLRTIQNFEKGKNYNGYVITGYRVLKELTDCSTQD